MKIGYLTMMVLNLNALVDAHRHEGVSLHDAKRHIGAKTVFSWLEGTFGRDVDFSLFDADTRARISDELQNLMHGYAGDEHRKWGIQNNGICLLIAWTNELIQQKVREVRFDQAA